jgi:hypothetical protein
MRFQLVNQALDPAEFLLFLRGQAGWPVFWKRDRFYFIQPVADSFEVFGESGVHGSVK